MDPATIAVQGRNAQEYVLSSSLHPQGVALVFQAHFPDGSTLFTTGGRFPVAFGYHGSGGLNREPAVAGNECTQVMETKYREMTDVLLSEGIAVIWLDSFYSRDTRFCEDNTAEFRQFAPPVMDGALQQVLSRLYDTVFGETALCSTTRLDCTRMMRIGTSEGGTAALLPTHRFLDHSLAQLFDANSPRNRLSQLTLMSHADLPAGRPQPRVVMPISPGCGFFSAIPFSTTGATEDLFYPVQPVHLEIGSTDTVPAECTTAIGQGRRQLQALEVQTRESIQPADFRYQVTIHAGAGHPLWEEQTATLTTTLRAHIQAHLR